MRRWVSVLCLCVGTLAAGQDVRQTLIQGVFDQPAIPDMLPDINGNTWETNGNRAKVYRPEELKSDRLAIVIQGHAPTLDDYGIAETRQALVSAGVTTVVVGMPGRSANAGSTDHDSYTSLRPFLEPVIAILNQTDGEFSETFVIGLSGGGWTATVAAAMDERIDGTIEISGSLPIHLRARTHDWEQTHVATIASYPAMYALGSVGRWRIQVLNPNDSCCFQTPPNYQETVIDPVNAVASLTGGSCTLLEDRTIPNDHKISTWAIHQVILPAFGVEAPPVENYDQTIDSGVILSAEGFPNTSNQRDVWTRWDVATASGGSMFAAPHVGDIVSAEWDFGEVNGDVIVSATWATHPNRSTKARYEALVGNEVVATWAVNQRANVYQSRTLDLGTVAGSGNLTIRLTNERSDGYVIADAVRIRTP